MSLWDKWEKEKRRKMGLPVEKDVVIRDSHVKPKLQNQLMIVAAVIAGCLGLIMLSVFIESAYTGKRWSETFIVRLFAEKNAQREGMTGSVRLQ